MRRLQWLLQLTVYSVVVFWTPASFAQANQCIRGYLTHLAANPPEATLGIAPNDAVSIVSRLVSQTGASFTITVVPCPGVGKVQAFQADGTFKQVPAGRYIIYDPVWVREVVGRNPTEATFIFGHELGHFIKNHFGAVSPMVIDTKKETEADEEGGCAVALLKADVTGMEGMIYRIRSETGDDQYPSQTQSLSAARLGYTRCGGEVRVREKRTRVTAGAGPSPLGMYLVMQSEGFIGQAYRDAAGFLSIGYGHLVTMSKNETPKSVKVSGVDIDISKDITPVQAFLLLAHDMARTSEAVDELVTQPLSPGQRAALESFIFNVGVGRFKNSTLLKLINENRFDLVPAQMSRWTVADGKLIPGLQKRRDLEIGMWLTPTD